MGGLRRNEEGQGASEKQKTKQQTGTSLPTRKKIASNLRGKNESRSLDRIGHPAEKSASDYTTDLKETQKSKGLYLRKKKTG